MFAESEKVNFMLQVLEDLQSEERKTRQSHLEILKYGYLTGECGLKSRKRLDRIKYEIRLAESIIETIEHAQQ